MTDAKYDVLGIGNAIFDVLVQTDEDFLAKPRHDQGRHGADRRGPRRGDLQGYGPGHRNVRRLGANTIVGLAGFGARAAFIGKVKDDQIGTLYTHDIRAAGVAFETKPAEAGPATGCSYILVTPDGERTMNTYLGAAQDLSPADIDEAQIAAAAHRLSRRLSVGPRERQGSLRQGRHHRAQGRPPGGADAVGFVLRRSLSR